MNKLASASILLSASLAFSYTAHSSTITNADLPGSIQSCITAATCFVSNTSSYDSGTTSAYEITQLTGNGFENNWLMRYTLVGPPQSYGGYLWVLAKDTYSISETAHPFTLYTDKATPAFVNLFGQSGDINLFMTTTDVLAGSGYKTWGLDASYNSYGYGNLTGDVPLPCLAEGCQTHAKLNLAQLSYVNFGSVVALASFNPSDTRGLVYTQGSSSPCYGDPYCTESQVQSFYVSAVPLPSAVWLFGTGLLGFLGFSKRKIRR